MRRKLIRDRLDGSNSPWGAVTVRPVESEAEHFHLLLEKLVEEAAELRDAYLGGEHNQILEESADLEEILMTLRSFRAITMFDVTEVGLQKRIEKGGFFRGNVMEEAPADNLLVYDIVVDVDCPHWKDPELNAHWREDDGKATRRRDS